MNRFIILFFLIVFCFFSGCAWFSPQKTIPEEKSPFIETGKIIDTQALKEGGKLLIVPFSAGPGVEANAQLDKIALMLIRGILDVLETSEENFEIVFSENSQKADLIIDGHITQIGQSPKIKQWVLRSKKRTIGIKGKMIDRKTGHTILIFSDKRANKKKSEDHQQLALTIGQDIGRFILSGIRK